MEIERRLDEYAARQYGVLTREQALATGMTDEMISNRLGSGRWMRMAAGVYAYASAPPKWHRQVAAAYLSQPRAIIGGRSAAHLHGFEGYGPGRPELLVPANGNARSRLARLVRDSHFDQIATTKVVGFRVSTIAETLWTLSSRLERLGLARLVDGQLAARILEVGDFDPILDRIHGERRPGGPRLRAVLDDRRFDAFQPATTALEGHLYALLDSPGIPEYRRQCPLRLDEEIDAVLDAFVEDWAMIVEADGRRWHTRQADFGIADVTTRRWRWDWLWSASRTRCSSPSPTTASECYSTRDSPEPSLLAKESEPHTEDPVDPGGPGIAAEKLATGFGGRSVTLEDCLLGSSDANWARQRRCVGTIGG